MKKLFLALVSLSLLASCSMDKELQQNEGNPISFTSEIGTRATSFVTTDNMNYFYSTAFNGADEVYFDKLLFNKNGEYFTSDPEYYWPGDGSELRFYCYATSDLSSDMGLTEPEGTAGEYMLKNVTPKSDISEQVDFVYGASRAPQGKAIIAMPSTTNKGGSKIAPVIIEGGGVVTTRPHVHYVVTEFGAVDLYGKSMQERAKLLISIAHPDHQEALDRAAFERFGPHYLRIK